MTHDIATVAQLAQFDELIDVRSPAEFALDHVPGAHNCPVLNNEERARVGSLYAQVSVFEARKVGAALVARNIARHIEGQFHDRPRDWKPLVYCWRGGKRSAAMTHVLRQVGWDARQLAGGYKSFRRTVVAELEQIIAPLSFRVICGMTGTGKSKLLQHLAERGAQVLDLEALAGHRGSLLGGVPGVAQPSQKMFETRLWQALRALDPARPVYVEAESRKIGDVRTPETLLARMWSSACVVINASIDVRVELLLSQYQHLTLDRVLLHERLDCLIAMRGRERIAAWKALSETGAWRAFVEAVLTQHYDPSYRKSIEQHYPNLPAALHIQLPGAQSTHFAAIAESLLR